jgi:hypothetical protein
VVLWGGENPLKFGYQLTLLGKITQKQVKISKHLTRDNLWKPSKMPQTV